jgi:ABC-type protease/lipase transport system fused ATPase/permease subunit
MMQVLDRVVPSENLNTLLMLMMVALGALVTHGLVEFYRDQFFAKTARWIEAIGVKSALEQAGSERQAAITNVGLMVRFFKGPAATITLNIIWIPLFLIAIALIHPFFLLLISGVIAILLGIKFISQLAIHDKEQTAIALSQMEHQVLKDSTDFHIVAGIRAITENLCLQFASIQSQRHLNENQITMAVSMRDSSLGFVRTATQILALALGASLVVNGDLSSGGMIGASIITAKTISTIETSINNIDGIKLSYAAYQQMRTELKRMHTTPTEVADVSGALLCEGLIYPRGGGAAPRLDRVSFSLNPGECLAIIGDSGSGKTTLLNALCGIDPCPIGSAFLDQSEVRTLGPITTNNIIGYLPQQARLLKGTLAQNISCFAPDPADEKIVAAAKTAGVHGLISALPEAYETDIGKSPFLLSAGQKQRVALARAIFQSPKYLFLDEPNALLDATGERQLCDTLAKLKSDGTTIIMVLHRSGIMGLADKVLLLNNGRTADFGVRAEVLGRMSDGRQNLKIPMNATSLQDLHDWVEAQFSRHSDKAFCQKAILVSTEIFNAACQNGPQDISRHATFVFKFMGETKCEITLKEGLHTKAAEKMKKIRSLVRHPEVNMLDLSPDEIALAVLSQLADKLKIENIENTSLFSAWLTSDQSKLADLTKH